MSADLTPSQLSALNFIADFLDSHGYAPSYREICAGMGWTSVNAGKMVVEALQKKGHLMKDRNVARSLRLTRKDETSL